MTEQDYINLSNRVRLSLILELLGGLLPSDTIKKEELAPAQRLISKVHDRLWKSVQIDVETSRGSSL